VWPYYGTFNNGNQNYGFAERTGPHRKDESGDPYTYFGSLDSKIPRVLYAPGRGRRISGEWNDGGFQTDKFGQHWEGPDLWLDVIVPKGMHRFTLYNFNGATTGMDRRRDFTVEVRRYLDPIENAQHAPVLARARVVTCRNTAYRTFLLHEGRYWVRIASNYSHMSGLTAAFFDHANVFGSAADDSTSYYLKVPYDPPAVPNPRQAVAPQLRAATDLWNALDAAYGHASAAAAQMPYRMLAYRAASAAGAHADLLANWRWTLHLWTPEDRAQWERVMVKSRATTQAAKQTSDPE
jgi:hypothetical protein